MPGTNKEEVPSPENWKLLGESGAAPSPLPFQLPNFQGISDSPNRNFLFPHRLIPLELVDIYIHNVKERRLKIHMATGRNYYLQLCAPDGEEGFLFERWMRLIYLLHVASGKVKPPSEVPSKEVGLHTIWKTDSLPSETQVSKHQDIRKSAGKRGLSKANPNTTT